MRAILLAGGKGTRLKPYTTLIPKPLVPIGGDRAILEIVLQQLKRDGFTHATLAVNHMANLIMAYIGDGSKWGLKVDYSLEDKPLSTIGPLTQIPDLPEHFLVMNGDVLSDIDYGKFLREHQTQDRRLTVSSYKRDSKIDFGIIQYDTDKLLTSFQEKPEYHFEVSMGVYAMSRRLLGEVPKGEKYGFDDLMMDSLKHKREVVIRPFDGFWLDIGRPEDYDYANENYGEISKKLGLAS